MADAAATTTAAPPAVTTVAALPSIVFASLAGSAVLVELTVPQIVRLSLPTKTPLPNTPLAARIAMQPRLLGPQTALTTLQFGLTREVRDLLDRALGPNKLHLSAAYGIASGPCRAAAYNLLIAGTYAYHGRSAQGGTDSLPERARTFWLTKVKPGLLWSVLRDSGSVGGGIVLAPTVTPRDAPPPLKFACGVGAGALCGLATQLFHNAALTAGRLAEQRRSHGTFEAMARCFAEHGLKAAVLGAQYRVGVIALWTGILGVAEPFRR
mmetsp:Transcript_8762/g.26193  ORF Transcript_8762/g.26193 Transcript_8762/m.26193 type:complete len:267 (+) Transcript_8762:1097-1897(+)